MKQEAVNRNSDWNEVYDLVVVGSGAGGMTAAITARDRGLSTLVVEKTELYGGSSAMSGGGVWIPNNHLQRKAGYADSSQEALTYLKAVTAGEVSEDRLETYVAKAPEMMEYLEDKTRVRFAVVPRLADYFPNQPGAKPEGGRSLETRSVYARHVPDTGHMGGMPRSLKAFGRMVPSMSEAVYALNTSFVGRLRMARVFAAYFLNPFRSLRGSDPRLVLGQALIGRLRASMADRSIPLWLNSPLERLIVEDGRVAGVEVARYGVPRFVKAEKGVVLAAGGFAHNRPMRQEYQREPITDQWTAACPGNTGEAIQMAMELGAQVSLMDDAWWMPTTIVPGWEMPYVVVLEKGLPHSMFVNSKGRRFANEAEPYINVVNAMYAANGPQARSIPCWFVFDQAFRSKYPIGTIIYPLLPPPRRLIDSGFLKVGRTVEELARECGIDPRGLVEEVEKYNGFAATGVDADFNRGSDPYQRYYADPAHKPNPCLGRIAKPPYYAIPVLPGDLGTKGGPNTDTHGRVLQDDGSPIEGLYAVGNNSASVMGHSYPGAGATIGAAMTFGYVAALHAAGSQQ